jgi:hypothetical protein
MADIFVYVGLVIFVIGGVGFLIAAFKTSLIWGLGCLITPVQVIFLFIHWERAKKPFAIQLIGGLIMLSSVYSQGKINI